MDKERVEILLNKLLPVIIPKEVVDIVFDVHHTSPNEFTLHAVFVVSDKLWDSYDPINKPWVLDLDDQSKEINFI